MILTVTLNASIDKRYVVDSFKEGEVNRVRECSFTPGGKGLNVSKPAAIYGEEVVATGFAGGHSGDYITESLAAFHIKNKFYRLSGESRSCINIWDLSKKKQTEFLEPGLTVTQKEFEDFLTHFSPLIDEASVVSMSGSVPKGLDGTAYRKLIKLIKSKGKPVILDTSGTLLEEGIKEAPTLVKPNIDEIRMLTGNSCNTEDELFSAAEAIHQKGVKIVVISLGAKGSVALSDEGVFRARVPKIDAVNTVGCGDSMTAGFAIGLEKNLDPEETLRLASAISAAAALREETGFFVKEDMLALLPKIDIQKIR